MTLATVEFDVEEFREFGTQRGERIRVHRGSRCPCNDPMSGTHDRQCSLCGGIGTIWTTTPEVKQLAPYHPKGMGKWSFTGGKQVFEAGDSIKLDAYRGALPKLKVTTPITCTVGKTLTLSVTAETVDPETGQVSQTTLTKIAVSTLAAGTYDFDQSGVRILAAISIAVTVSGGGSVTGGLCYVEGWRIDYAYRALVRQVDEQKIYARYGQLYVGDITITTMPDELPIGELDLIDLVDRPFRREEVLTQEGTLGDSIPLHWIPAAKLISVRTLAKEYVVDVTAVLGGGEDEIPGGSGEVLAWVPPEEGPSPGDRVSVVYYWTPRYFVLPSMIATRRLVGDTQMPQRVVARLKGREEFRE